MSLKLAFLIVLAVPVFYFDIRYRRIPNWITLGSWLGYGSLLFGLSRRFPADFVLASLLAGLTYLLIRLLSRKKLGMGDVKLSLILGGINGLIGWYFTNLFACFLALGVFLLLRSLKKADTQSKIPFGPFLCTGGITHQILQGAGVL